MCAWTSATTTQGMWWKNSCHWRLRHFAIWSIIFFAFSSRSHLSFISSAIRRRCHVWKLCELDGSKTQQEQAGATNDLAN
uniref:Uncharacterized protein n=1 Tax=Aegilops tauschii subsp. strangulata TaxID=200361 RepID=A0A453LFX1_AEGTS